MSDNKAYLAVAVSLVVLTIFELLTFSRLDWGMARNYWLLGLASTKGLLVALIYMNLRREGWALKLAFFILIPVAAYFLLFMLYDAAYLWKS